MKTIIVKRPNKIIAQPINIQKCFQQFILRNFKQIKINEIAQQIHLTTISY